MTKRIFLLMLALPLVLSISAQEICDNGIDDDGDGLIDLNDNTECVCDTIIGNANLESFIPNPSFEDISCCPNGLGDLDCADTWIQASTPTSDYFNTCDYVMVDMPMPFPDGEGCVGAIFKEGWAEYVGACINSPLIAGDQYVLNMGISSVACTGGLIYQGPNPHGPIDITVYGSPNCADLPFNSTGCPIGVTPDWEILGVISYDPSETWTELDIVLTSTVDINAVAIGPPCDLSGYGPDWNEIGYFFFDDLILNTAAAFEANLTGAYYNAEHDVWVNDGTVVNELTGVVETVGAICFDELVVEGESEIPGDYQWYYQGVALTGETDSMFNVAYEDFMPGDYQFVVFASDSDYCSLANFETEDIPTYPIADFTYDTPCYPGSGDLIDLTQDTYSVIGWEWDIDGTLLANLPSVTHLYNTGPDYTATLIVETSNYCKDTLSFPLILDPGPIVDFNYADACEDEIMQLNDLSTVLPSATITGWEWDFNGGSGSTNIPDPTHAYSIDSDYNIELFVTTSDGCVDSLTQTVTIHPVPDVLFTLDPVCAGTAPAFFTDQSMINTGVISQYDWTFGDGQTSTDSDPAHMYDGYGRYDVQLLVTSGLGCQDSLTLEQIVSESVAQFNYTDTMGCSPFIVDFQSESYSEEGTLISYLWEFSNADSSSLEFTPSQFWNTDNEYDAYYDAKLTVVDNFGCVDELLLEDLITVFPRPDAAFETNIDETNDLSPVVTYTNTSIGGETYQWDLGDGDFSEDFEVVHRYYEGNDYFVELLVETEHGCLDTALVAFAFEPQPYVYIPNGFTPDEDGLNDYFKPVITGVIPSEYRFLIFDRDGTQVFKTGDYEAFWNGSYNNNKSYYVPDGVYVYRMEIRFEGESEIRLHEGMVTILR